MLGGETEGGGATSIMSGIGQDDKASGGGTSGGVGAGEVFEGDRSSGGNRWPRQETIALLKIRSDMDVVFRDSSLKGPLWVEVSRKMAELGYHRSAKKCKEKFENVYKYHKRTKEGRVGKSDGKTYRFFAELEALEQHQQQQQQLQQHHLSLPPIPPRQQPVASDAVPVTMLMPAGSTVPSSPHPISIVHVNPHHHHQQQHIHVNIPVQALPVVHSSPIQMGNSTPSSPEGTASPSPSLSSSSTSSDEEILGGQRKRKRKWKDFFEKLMKDVVDKQEELQKRFLEVVEKREHDRLVRDEAWKMQEMARLNRERELLVQERSMAAAKDAALISFLQKLSDQQQVPFPLPVQIQDQIKTKTQINSQPSGSPQVVPPTTTNQSNCSQPPPPQPSPLPQPQPPARVEENLVSVAQSPQPLNQFPRQQPPPPTTQLAMVVASTNNIISTISATNVEVQKTNGNGENHNNNFLTGASSSRWPKAEIEALINLRSNLDQKYQENGPKGPLWEEISAAMKKIGYNRNAKRCKEKWENINKYFKKVKESNKKRPEDSKTCPYFHQLDALYREKKLMEITTTTTTTTPTTAINNSSYHQVVTPMTVQSEQQWPLQHHDNNDSENTEDDDGEDDEEDEHGNRYEIVANNAGGSMGPTTSIATTTA